MFNFLAKQGQSQQVCRVLSQYGKPHCQLYNGPRGKGVMISMEGSKGLFNRALKAAGVVGAHCSRLPVVKIKEGDLYRLKYMHLPAKFVLSYKGKIGKARLSRRGCACCGLEYSLDWKGEEYVL